MEKIKYIFLALIGLALTLGACSDGSEINETLETDEIKVELTFAEQTKNVSFTASKGETVLAEWRDSGLDDEWGGVTVDKASGVIVISVKENTTADTRKASVIVSLASGWRNQMIEVTQSASQDVLVEIPERVVFDLMGCEQIIKIPAGIGAWTVQVGAPWVHIQSYPKANELLVSLDKNTEFSPRSSTLTIKAGSLSKEVVLEQDPVPYFITPYLDFNKGTEADLLAFEKSRHSRYVGNAGDRIFLTNSPFFKVINYEFSDLGEAPGVTLYNAALMTVATTNDIPILAKEYVQYLVDLGFQYLMNRQDGLYYWLPLGPEDGVTKHVIARFFPSKTTVSFYWEKVIERDAPTFPELPYAPAGIEWGVNDTPIRAWESANQGVIDEEGTTGLIYVVPASTDIRMRVYMFKEEVKQNLNIREIIFFGMDRMFTKKMGITSINANLFELLEKEGFGYLGLLNKIPVWGNKEKNLAVELTSYNDAGDLPTDPIKYTGFRFHPHAWLDQFTPAGAVERSYMFKAQDYNAPKGLETVYLNME